MAELLMAEKSAIVVLTDRNGKKTRRTVKAGKLYRSDDPIVRGRDHLFQPVVEQMTAAPGEKRSVTRSRRKAKAEQPKPEASELAQGESQSAEQDPDKGE